MVGFHEHIITDLLDDPTGGLVILSSGLSLSKLISSLLSLHSPKPLLLLNSSLSQSHFINKTHSLPNITSDLPLTRRLSLYASGSPLFVTSRILVVDLLTGRLDPTEVAGVVVVNAHSVGEGSTEAFIVRLMRERNKDVVVWAFSDRAQAMVAGFAKTERIMRCLYLKKLHLWPRFQVMREEWEKYLLSKVELRNAAKHNKKKAKGPKGFGVLDGVSPVVHAQKEESGVINQEKKALLAAAAKITRKSEHDIIDENIQPCVGRDAKKKGKRKDGNDSTEIIMSETKEPPIFNQSVLQRHSVGLDATTSKDKILPPVCFYALESEQDILGTLKPSTVVVYHPDMAFVREIEIYKAENPSKQVKVYFLFYEESTEVQKFESSIRRENGAFESLIRQKSLMMIPVDQDGRCLGPSSSINPQPSTLQNSITRKAGGRKEAEMETRIIVDMREFMSSLPNVLHQKGMRILPVTLEVGDYILSPLICVERKSIQDLFGSFASGRLFNQVEMMSRYYQMPVLLIEFSQDKSFSFLSASDIGDDVTPNSIISKLCLLVLHFPRLRIVWSRSLHATAEIFANLKANQDEPDEVKAIRVGVPSEEGIVENDVRAENYNTSAVEFLRRLPGVTDSNNG